MSVKSQHWTAPGAFGSKQIQGELFANDGASWLVLFLHGCCGGPYDLEPTFYTEVVSQFAEENKFSTAFYESSRNIGKRDFFAERELTEKSYQDFLQAGFQGKTWEDEVQDAQNALNYLVEKIPKNRSNDIKIALVGFSLGGLLATKIAVNYPVDKIFCFGSALGFTVPPETPIIGQGIAVDDIVSAAQSYKNDFFLYRGTKDTTALFENAYRLFSSFDQAGDRRFIEWRGVDHRFRTTNGQVDPELWMKIKQEVTRELSG